jgi:hypothetical protein
MKKIPILLLVITCILNSCKQEPKIDYKYANKEDLFKCSTVDMDLIKEAHYAFEDFILKNYDFSRQGNIIISYHNFLKLSESDLIPIAERFDDHLKNIVKALKNEKGMWKKINGEYTLNYNNPISTCITNNIKNEEFLKVFNALASTNTLKPSTIAPTINRNLETLLKNKALKSYIALDLFYAKVFNLNFSLSPQELSKKIGNINSERAKKHQHQH